MYTYYDFLFLNSLSSCPHELNNTGTNTHLENADHMDTKISMWQPVILISDFSDFWSLYWKL